MRDYTLIQPEIRRRLVRRIIVDIYPTTRSMIYYSRIIIACNFKCNIIYWFYQISIIIKWIFNIWNKTYMRILIAKEAFNRKISSLTSKLNNGLRKELVSYFWSIALYGPGVWTLTKLEWKYLESFEKWCWRRMEKIKCWEKVTNGQVSWT